MEELIQHRWRVCFDWGKFRELSGILTRKDVLMKIKGKVYLTCVRSAMLYGSETQTINAEQIG